MIHFVYVYKMKIVFFDLLILITDKVATVILIIRQVHAYPVSLQ